MGGVFAGGVASRQPGVAGHLSRANPRGMADQDEPTALDRIDGAIARIEAAVAARTRAANALARRHAALKSRMAEAVAALDDVIARGSVG